MKLKNIAAVSLFLLFLFILSACGSAGSTNNTGGGSGNKPAVTTTDALTGLLANTNFSSSMLECEVLSNVSDGKGNTFNAYTMPNIPDPNSFTGISGSASMCVAGVPGADGTATVDVPSDLPSCLTTNVTFFRTGSVIPAYVVPDGYNYCIATNGS